jgi:hypothetical protein
MKKKSTLVYPNIPSAIRPEPHCDGLPIPEPPDNLAMYSDDEQSASSDKEEEQKSSHQLHVMQTNCQAHSPPII